MEKITTVPNPADQQPAAGAAASGSDANVNGHQSNGVVKRSSQNGANVNLNGVASSSSDSDGRASRNKPSKAHNGALSYADVAGSTLSSPELERDEDDVRPDPRRYPALPRKSGARSPESEAWKAGGVRFAPVRIPLVRRLQTAAVLFHCMSIVLLVSIFWFTCANPFAWPILVPYLIHLSVSNAATDGKLAYRSEYLRSLPLWRLFAGYYPAKLHKTHDLPADRKYIFGYHPHGIISHGAWCAFATNALGFADKFPGITNSLLTLDSNFRLPFYRDWILAMGLRSVSKESIWNILSRGGPQNDGRGRAVTIVVGGARESLEAQPGSLRLILQGRKGFIKMALRTGADLVPVLAFGENDLYDQLSPKAYPLVHKFQMLTLKIFKFTVPAMHGRGVLNYDVGLMPYRTPVNIVIGKPIRVDGAYGNQPDQADIDRYHELYVQEVERLWETYKDQFAPERTSELKIIS